MTAGDLRKEVWSRPGSNPFERIDIEPPGPFNFTKRAAGGIGQGQITVPTTYERINDLIRRVPGDPGIDVRRLVRVYAEGVTLPVYEYFLDVTGDETGEGNVTLEGAGVESFMSDGTVAPWDWDGQDESTSTFPDWVWGGKELVGPVETTFQPHIARVWTVAAGGSFQFGVSINGGGYDYASIAVGASAFTVQTAVIALSNVDAATVQGSGTATNPWEISITAPAGTYTVALGANTLTGPTPRAFIELPQFGKLLPIGWTESRVNASPVPHGIVTDFRASLGGGSDPALPADCSAWIVFLGQEWFFPGVEKIIQVNPGSINQIPPLYLYAQGAAAQVRIVIRDMQEGFIAAEEITIPSNTLIQSVGLVNVMIPAGITQVKFRIGHIGPGTPPRIFIACPSMREGLIPTSAGGIFTQLFQDATVNHVADGRIVWENLAASGTSYLDLSFTTAVDSAGVAWDNMAMDFTATRGKSYLQVLTDLGSRGYRWSVTPSNTTGRWQVNLYNSTWVKVDATLLQTPAINVGSGVTSGPIYRSHLVGNAVTVEGQRMKFGRFESATSIASIGRREIYQPDKTLTTNAAATIRAAEEVAGRLLSGLSVSLNIEPVDSPIPLHAYDVDWNINVQVPPVLPKSAHRISAITATVTETGTSYKAAFSSEAFAGGQGVIEGVRRLLLKFEGLDPPEPEGLPTPIIGGGGAPTVVVAASDSSVWSKGRADFICTGTNDEGTIQRAIEAVKLSFGRVILCEGNYNIVTTGGQSAIKVWAGTSLLGLGMEKTYILVDSHSGAGTAIMVESQGNGYIRDLAFWNNTDSDITAIKLGANWGNLDVTRVRFDCDGRMIDTAGGNNNCVVAECILANGDFNLAEPQIRLDACRRWVIRDNEGFSGRNFVRVENDCTDINIHDNYAEQIGEEAIICQPGAGSHAGQAIKIHHNSFLISGAGGLFSAILIDTTGTITTSALSFHVDNNIIDGPIKYGIELIDAHHVRLFGNVIEEAGRHGIFLDASSDCMLHDNYVWQASQETDNTYDGIFLQGDSNDNSIQANKFIKHTGATPRTRYCVNVSALACDRTVVVSNQMRGGYQTAAINNAGTGTIITYPGGGAGIGDNFV